MSFTMIDAVIVAALVASLIIGYMRGFVRQLVSLFGWIIAYLVAYLFYDDLTPWVAKLPFFAFESEAASTSADAAGNVDGSGIEAVGQVASMLGIGIYVQRAIAFGLLFFAAKLAVSAAGWLLHSVASLPVLRTVNRFSGAVLALAEAVVLVFIVLLIMEALPVEATRGLAADSTLFGWVKSHTPSLMEHLQAWWSKPEEVR